MAAEPRTLESEDEFRNGRPDVAPATGKARDCYLRETYGNLHKDCHSGFLDVGYRFRVEGLGFRVWGSGRHGGLLWRCPGGSVPLDVVLGLQNCFR